MEKPNSPTPQSGKHLAEHANLRGTRFHDVCLAEAVFDNVSLSKAIFDNIDLSGSRFSKINMTGVEITDVNSTGMTINGISVDDLLRVYKQHRG